MASTFTDYQSITRDLTRALASTAKSPAVTARTKYFEAHIGEVKSVADLMKNYRLLSYALKAFGWTWRLARPGVRKVLEGGVDDPKSLANKMNDARFKEFARAFDFVRHGAATTQRAEASSDVVAKFTRQTLETGAGASNDWCGWRSISPARRPASAPPTTFSPTRPCLRSCAPRLACPTPWRGRTSTRRRERSKRKSISPTSATPTKTRRFVERFAAMADMTRGSTAAAAGGVGIGQDLLQSLQGLKLGGF